MYPWVPTGTPTLTPTPTAPAHPVSKSIEASRVSIPATRTTVRMTSLPCLTAYLLQREQRPRRIGDDGHGAIAQLWRWRQDDLATERLDARRRRERILDTKVGQPYRRRAIRGVLQDAGPIDPPFGEQRIRTAVSLDGVCGNPNYRLIELARGSRIIGKELCQTVI